MCNLCFASWGCDQATLTLHEVLGNPHRHGGSQMVRCLHLYNARLPGRPTHVSAVLCKHVKAMLLSHVSAVLCDISSHMPRVHLIALNVRRGGCRLARVRVAGKQGGRRFVSHSFMHRRKWRFETAKSRKCGSHGNLKCRLLAVEESNQQTVRKV